MHDEATRNAMYDGALGRSRTHVDAITNAIGRVVELPEDIDATRGIDYWSERYGSLAVRVRSFKWYAKRYEFTIRTSGGEQSEWAKILCNDSVCDHMLYAIEHPHRRDRFAHFAVLSMSMLRKHLVLWCSLHGFDADNMPLPPWIVDAHVAPNGKDFLVCDSLRFHPSIIVASRDGVHVAPLNGAAVGGGASGDFFATPR